MSHIRLMLNKLLCLSKYDSEVISYLFQPYNTENIDYNIDMMWDYCLCTYWSGELQVSSVSLRLI